MGSVLRESFSHIFPKLSLIFANLDLKSLAASDRTRFIPVQLPLNGLTIGEYHAHAIKSGLG